jgi:hypothetical protein
LETDVDCGGPQCSAIGVVCALGQLCAADGDCDRSGQCEAGISTSCSNDVVDGVETGVDCGGGKCGSVGRGCPAFQPGLGRPASRCNVGDDCLTGEGICVSYTNEVQDGQESAADCGGPACSACKHGAVCKADGDCASNYCFAAASDGGDSAGCLDGLSADRTPHSIGLHGEAVWSWTWLTAEAAATGFATHTFPLGENLQLEAVEAKLINTATAGTAVSTTLAATGLYATERAPVASICVSCHNELQDGAETGVDCGGPGCEKRSGGRAGICGWKANVDTAVFTITACAITITACATSRRSSRPAAIWRATTPGEVEMTAEDGEFKEDEFVVQVLAFTMSTVGLVPPLPPPTSRRLLRPLPLLQVLPPRPGRERLRHLPGAQPGDQLQQRRAERDGDRRRLRRAHEPA